MAEKEINNEEMLQLAEKIKQGTATEEEQATFWEGVATSLKDANNDLYAALMEVKGK